MTDLELTAAIRTWRDAEAVAANARGEPMFMGKPDAWFEDTHWFCVNGHVSGNYLKSEERGELCLECREPVILGPTIGERAFAPILLTFRARTHKEN